MTVTSRRLNRATLQRQLLLQREPVDVVDAVHRVVALQAQEPASPYVALWNRVAGFDPADLDAAFVGHRVVKSTLMRVTLHAVTAGDHPTFREAVRSTLRASRLGDRRFTGAGLDSADADRLVPHLLAAASQVRDKDELIAALAAHVDPEAAAAAWWALRSVAPLIHAPTDAVWSFGLRPAYLAAPTGPAPGDPDASLRQLVLRYLAGFGPASPEDLAQFALLKRTVTRPAMRAIPELVRLEGPTGEELYDLPDTDLPDEDAPAPPRLMAMWDSTLLAYTDRSRIIPAEHRSLVIRRNGDVLPTVLVDGYVAGVWRAVDGGIEVRAFRHLPDPVWAALEGEAADLLATIVARDPALYRRFGRWWNDLPAAEQRTIGAV